MQTNKFKILLWIFAPCAALFAISFFLFSDNLKTHATGTISGRVFQDYNSNGNYDTSGTSPNLAIDTGIAAVTITVYDSGGNARGTTVSATNGTYSLVANGTGPYRVEFTNLPSGYSPSARSTDSVAGGTATNSGSTVQFLSDGNSSNVNLALNIPTEYCQTDPKVATTRMVYGTNVLPSIMTFQMSYTDDRDGNILGTSQTVGVTFGYTPAVPARTQFSSVAQTGTIYGVAWNKKDKMLYTSSFVKRHSVSGGTANETTGGIYQTDASQATSLYVDLNSVFGAGTTGNNPHPRATTNWANDTTTRELIGKYGLGDLDISPDDSTLYVVNLLDKRLYAIPTSGTLNSTTIQRYNIPTAGIATSTGRTCNANDVRPFGLGYDRQGQLYVGGVCSAETTQNTLDMRMYVWRFDVGTFTLVFNSDNLLSSYHPWANPTTQDTGTAAYIQPILSDIVFDGNDMVLGIRDRFGDQTPSDGGTIFEAPVPHGNTVRTCWNGSAWIKENNATCGSITTAGANNTQGFGNGEYYYQDEAGDGSSESNLGSLLQVPGYPDVMTTAFDSVSFHSNGTRVIRNYGAAGVQRYNKTTGQQTGAYDVLLANTGDVNQFWKSNGLGDIEAMCDAAPIEIGNRVWRDTDGDGVQDPGELPIAGVTVHLYDSNNVLIATAVADANGEYYFTSGSAADGNTTDNIGIVNGQITPNTNYQIRFDNPADYTSGGPLFALFLSPANSTFQNGDDDSSDSDAVNVTNPSGSPAGAFPVISVTTGGAGQNNHTLDVGFNLSPTAASVSVGGRIQASDGRGIRNVIISLTTANGTTRFARSGSFGYYNFDEVESGQTITVSVQSKRFTFSQSTIAFSLEDAVDDLIFTADLPTLPSSPVKAEAIRNNQIVLKK